MPQLAVCSPACDLCRRQNMAFVLYCLEIKDPRPDDYTLGYMQSCSHVHH
jgi:hypothetical protein